MTDQKLYTGTRHLKLIDKDKFIETEVKVFYSDIKILNPRIDILNHGPHGFDWGYEGPGPSQLSFAILIDYLENPDDALSLYQDFERKIISKLKQDIWRITDFDMWIFLKSIPGHK